MRRSGQLAADNDKAVDLDADPGDATWNYTTGEWDTSVHDIGYPRDGLTINGSDHNLAVLGTGTGWNYSSCRAVSYPEEDDFDQTWRVGVSFCVITTKGRFALLRTRSVESQRVIYDITVWE